MAGNDLNAYNVGDLRVMALIGSRRVEHHNRECLTLL
jgi:hypothetical protein